jgi:GT2 family glycosyltransferase
MAPFFAAFEPSDQEADVRDLARVIGRPFVLTSSIALRRELAASIGGFDPRFGPREGAPLMCEDIDLCLRYQDAGGTIRYVPSSVVVHELDTARANRRFLVRRWYWQGRSTWLLDEDAFRRAKFLGVRGMYRAFFETWTAARSSGDPHLILRLTLDAAFRAGLLYEGLRHLRRGVRGWRTGAAPRRSSFNEDAKAAR